MKAIMNPKNYGLNFASHSSTGSLSRFSNGNLDLYVGQSSCDNQNLSTSCGDGAVGKSWASDLRVAGWKPLSGDRVFIKISISTMFSEFP